MLSYTRVDGLEAALFAPSASNLGSVAMAFMGKLADGTSISTAQAEFDTIASNFSRAQAGTAALRFKISPYFTSWGGIADCLEPVSSGFFRDHGDHTIHRVRHCANLCYPARWKNKERRTCGLRLALLGTEFSARCLPKG
jgi:hypothetical protein